MHEAGHSEPVLGQQRIRVGRGGGMGRREEGGREGAMYTHGWGWDGGGIQEGGTHVHPWLRIGMGREEGDSGGGPMYTHG